MNEKQAIQSGYDYTGLFSYNKEEMKAEAAKLRQIGNKAVVVTIPPNKYSRGHHGTGYSVYWMECPANIAIRKLQEKNQKMNQLRNALADLERKADEIRNQMEALKIEIGG